MYLTSDLMYKKSNIFLVGFMGVGKSTLARKIAAKINYDFIDTDTYIENKFRVSVNDIIDSSGIKAFRKIEHDILVEITHLNKCVVATGGGMPCYKDNMVLIKENGFSIYIYYSPEIIFSRLKNAKIERPLVKGLDDEQLKTFIKNTLSERELFYNMADCIIKERNLKTGTILKPIVEFLAHG